MERETKKTQSRQEDGYNFPHFRFFQFFAGHTLIIAVALYFKIVKGYRIKLSSLLQAFAALNILAASAFAVNIMFDTNYMFLLHKPDFFPLLSVFAPWPYYLIELEILGFIVFLLIYAVTNIKSPTVSLPRFLKKFLVSPTPAEFRTFRNIIESPFVQSFHLERGTAYML